MLLDKVQEVLIKQLSWIIVVSLKQVMKHAVVDNAEIWTQQLGDEDSVVVWPEGDVIWTNSNFMLWDGEARTSCKSIKKGPELSFLAEKLWM